MIRSLVEVRSDSSKNAKISLDWTPGKSKGLVFLLHGDPGLGKTLTAETWAVPPHDSSVFVLLNKILIVVLQKL